jgi:tetratricopeptide (TPR) repeat protein
MRGCKVLVIGLGLCVLSGCSAFGVPYTSDPNQKLAYAFQLINESRPLPAERLIFEALETFKANGDKRGMAEAYRLYGALLRSFFYSWRGFYDKTVTLDNRYAKSIEYFEKAKEIYAENKDNANLTNIYLNMAITYELMNNKKAACTAFDHSLESNREYLKDNPSAKVNIPTGYKAYPEFVDAARKESGCDVNLDSYNKLILEVKNNDSVSISDLDKERITKIIIGKIKQKAPNRFGEIISQSSDPTTLHVVITLTRYEEGGNALTRFIIPGSEPMYIEAEVVLENHASKAQLSRHEVTKTGGGLHGRSGRSTTFRDLEEEFGETVVTILLRLFAQDHAPSSPQPQEEKVPETK